MSISRYLEFDVRRSCVLRKRMSLSSLFWDYPAISSLPIRQRRSCWDRKEVNSRVNSTGLLPNGVSTVNDDETEALYNALRLKKDHVYAMLEERKCFVQKRG